MRDNCRAGTSSSPGVDAVERQAIGQSTRAAVLFLVLIVAAPLVTAGAPGDASERLRATFVGGVVPGEDATVAVRWIGSGSESLLDIWVDFDGDGSWSDEDEAVVTRAPVVSEIEVFTISIPADAMIDCRTTARFKAHELTGGTWEANLAVVGGGCSFEAGFEYTDLQNDVYTLTVYDDGNGAALYIGGGFVDVGTDRASYIARWDGTGWASLDGPAGSSTTGPVYELVVYDDGSGGELYAGGSFTTAGGVTVNRIARWDGSDWSALTGSAGTGVDGSIQTLLVHDDGSGEALYVGGSFTSAGGIVVNRIARWDGSEWSALTGSSGTGMGCCEVRDLAEYDEGNGPVLFAAGGFSRAGGIDASSVARWDGSEWSTLDGATTGEGVESKAYSLVVYDNGGGEALYVGGSFGRGGGSLDIKRVAGWDGTDWFGLTGWPNHLNDAVYSLEVYDDGGGAELYAAGIFTGNMNGAVTLGRVARYDGSQWAAVSGPSANGTDKRVWELAALDAGGGVALWAGGSFRRAGGVLANFLASWNGTAWGPLPVAPNGGLDGDVSAMEVFDDGGGAALYAGGSFTEASGATVSHIASWDGTAWTALTGPSGTGTSHPVTALAVYDDGGGDDLYVGGSFLSAGGVAVNRIARWDGSGWSALTGPSETGTNSTVEALAVYDDGGGEDLYAGGGFSTAGGITVNHVARWDGSGWSALSGPSGIGTSSTVFALEAYDDGGGDGLFAGGSFGTAGGVNVSNVAKWDGSNWYGLYGPWAVGTSKTVRTLEVYDSGDGPELYAGGSFSEAGGVQVFQIARWNGSEWSALVGPFGPGMNGTVGSLLVHDDGSGEALYAGGWMTVAGGVTVNRVARWDGIGFSAVNELPEPGVGPEGSVLALATYDDGDGDALYLGGSFTEAGGGLSHRIAKLSCLPPGALFIDGFESGDTSAWSSSP